eukprot:gene11695-15789_t
MPRAAAEDKVVFVTVGTTSFDRLIDAASSGPIVELLAAKGYTRMVFQVGRGAARPLNGRPLSGSGGSSGGGGSDDGSSVAGLEEGAIPIEWYEFKPSLEPDIAAASLGTCTEVLRAGKPMMVVVNETLADNHQFELAKQLAADGHLCYATCSTLLSGLEGMDVAELVPYAEGKPELFATYLDSTMGFK